MVEEEKDEVEEKEEVEEVEDVDMEYQRAGGRIEERRKETERTGRQEEVEKKGPVDGGGDRSHFSRPPGCAASLHGILRGCRISLSFFLRPDALT